MSGIAAIVGVAESDLGETGLTVLELHEQAVSRALDDAGLSLDDVDGLATNGVGRFPTTHLAEHLGIRPRWTDSTFAGGSIGVDYVARAAEVVRAGLATCVVVSWVSNQRSARSRSLAGAQFAEMPDAVLEAPYSPLYPLSFYALVAQRWMHEHGRTRADLAEIAVAARSWARKNPKAFRHDAPPLTIEEVLASPLISSPLRTLDCCLVTDGGGAVVVTSDRNGVRILGHGEATTHASMAQAASLTRTGAAESSARALEAAEIRIADVDLLQVYDSFTITVAVTIESLGLCAPGEGAAFVRDQVLPVNTSGGGLSYCHPGQFGVLLVVEAVRQLRGEAGDRQVGPTPSLALCQGTGGILSHHATLLLGAP